MEINEENTKKWLEFYFGSTEELEKARLAAEKDMKEDGSNRRKKNKRVGPDDELSSRNVGG